MLKAGQEKGEKEKERQRRKEGGKEEGRRTNLWKMPEGQTEGDNGGKKFKTAMFIHFYVTYFSIFSSYILHPRKWLHHCPVSLLRKLNLRNICEILGTMPPTQTMADSDTSLTFCCVSTFSLSLPFSFHITCEGFFSSPFTILFQLAAGGGSCALPVFSLICPPHQGPLVHCLPHHGHPHPKQPTSIGGIGTGSN